ncbi:MAG: hypothetical protein M3R52_05715 [Acidobacteriota bacterium]|nr:hypothetical protein [Acidobacteriota bacterium]
MLRIGKNPKDSGEAQVSAEKQEEPGAPIEAETTATAAYSEVKGLVDSTGRPIGAYQSVAMDIAGREYYEAARARAGELFEEVIMLSIPRKEFERLNIKTTEVLAEAALAYGRIAKDQEEIERLKTETRAMLTRLRAA